jgi:hypothetical protein
MSQQPPEDAQLSADDPMMEQIEAATSTRNEFGESGYDTDSPDQPDETVGAEAGMGEPNTFEPEEVTDDDSQE